MPNLKKLREHYDEVLKDVWEEWDGWTTNPSISPFTDMDEIPELDERGGFNWSVGWLNGVAAALDWPLDRPLGPKQWSPKGQHPR